jgi:hypothetical protein
VNRCSQKKRLDNSFDVVDLLSEFIHAFSLNFFNILFLHVHELFLLFMNVSPLLSCNLMLFLHSFGNFLKLWFMRLHISLIFLHFFFENIQMIFMNFKLTLSLSISISWVRPYSFLETLAAKWCDKCLLVLDIAWWGGVWVECTVVHPILENLGKPSLHWRDLAFDFRRNLCHNVELRDFSGQWILLSVFQIVDGERAASFLHSLHVSGAPVASCKH